MLYGHSVDFKRWRKKLKVTIDKNSLSRFCLPLFIWAIKLCPGGVFSLPVALTYLIHFRGRWGGDGWYIYSAPFELYNRSLENTYICFLMWPPQHRHGNSNPVRFDRYEYHCVIYFWLHKRRLNPRFPLHAAILDEDSIPNIQIFWSSLRFRCQGILCIIFGVRGFVLASHDL